MLVYPEKEYGGVLGKDLIREYLSKYWKKNKTPDTGRKRQYKYRKKIRYGHRSIGDIEKLIKLGNVLNDKSFSQHKNILKNLNGKQREEYFKRLEKKKKKMSFKLDNELKSWWHASIEEKRITDLKKRDQEEKEEDGDFSFDDFEDIDAD